LEEAANFVTVLNKRLLATLKDSVPAVKLQSAFYEALGVDGIKALMDTVQEAKKGGFIVIIDSKRNDISNTASAYAQAYLGRTPLRDEIELPVFDCDAITVTPYLGTDSLEPFVSACEDYNKGIFVVVRSSNPSGEQIQDLNSESGTVSQVVAEMVQELHRRHTTRSTYGYGPIGVVLGATVGDIGQKLRALVPQSIVLVPGYGAQGGTSSSSLQYADSRGLGALISSSRGILYGSLDKGSYISGVKRRVNEMIGNLTVPNRRP